MKENRLLDFTKAVIFRISSEGLLVLVIIFVSKIGKKKGY